MFSRTRNKRIFGQPSSFFLYTTVHHQHHDTDTFILQCRLVINRETWTTTGHFIAENIVCLGQDLK